LPESYPELDKTVSLLKENPTFKILLEGHTDNQGDWSENLKLSNDRVETVKNYLISKGILSSRIQVKGWGGTKPVSSNLTEERRKLNRRVEFTLFSE
jgi:outer membrane protein OmpA-like peptidoglycan-associated protein